MEAGLGSSGAAAAAISTDERAGPRVRTRSEPGARIASNEMGRSQKPCAAAVGAGADRLLPG